MQAFALNIRRDKFRDPRVRRALNFAFDFEEMNKQLFYGQYKRISSYFDGTELASAACRRAGAGDPRYGARRSPGRGVHRGLYQSGRRQPGGGAQEPARRSEAAQGSGLRGATASWSTQDRRRSSRSNCCEHPTFERIMLFFKPSLERLGIAVSMRTVDPANTRTACAAGTSTSSIVAGPNRCRPATSSATTGARKRPTWPGSRNVIGIKNPAVDKLIERLIFAKDRDDLVAATKALDRVLLWNHYVVPQWTYPNVAPRAGTVSAVRPSCRNTA